MYCIRPKGSPATIFASLDKAEAEARLRKHGQAFSGRAVKTADLEIVFDPAFGLD